MSQSTDTAGMRIVSASPSCCEGALLTGPACPYIHDPAKLGQSENTKKRFNVDSPSFTPLQTSTNGSLTPAARSAAISPKAANAAVFTPKSQRSGEFVCSSYYRFSNDALRSGEHTESAHEGARDRMAPPGVPGVCSAGLRWSNGMHWIGFLLSHMIYPPPRSPRSKCFSC